ncbi:MAG TPA: type IV pilus assembly protein PilM [Alphaproteobacteria bacterium]|nr:type IV pilus assembly protein PilM [Alphaproteobacteria bacterium]
MWFQRAKTLIGIDIGSHAIKLVRFGLAGARHQLLNVAMLPLPPATMVDGAIAKPFAVQDTLRRLLTLEKITEKNVALALSGHSVIVKRVQMVRMTEKELVNAIPFEAEQHIPFEAADVNTDFQILDSPSRGNDRGNHMEVLLAAAKRDRIDELSRVARAVNLRPVVVDVDMLALINCFALNHQEEVGGHVVSLVHIGASMMTVLIVKDGLSTFQRDIPFGGNQYTAALQKAFNLQAEDAEAMKLGSLAGSRSQPEMLTVLQRVTEEGIAEIQRSFDFYLASAGDEPIEKVYLSGGCARMKGLAQVLAARLRLPVDMIAPFRQVEVADAHFDGDYVRDIGPMMAVAAGLALRRQDER